MLVYEIGLCIVFFLYIFKTFFIMVIEKYFSKNHFLNIYIFESILI